MQVVHVVHIIILYTYYYCEQTDTVSKVVVSFRGCRATEQHSRSGCQRKAHCGGYQAITCGIVRKFSTCSVRHQVALPRKVHSQLCGIDTEPLKPHDKHICKIIAMGRSRDEVTIVHDELAQAKKQPPPARGTIRSLRHGFE